MGRAQAPSIPPAHAGTEAEEPVRGKNALKNASAALNRQTRRSKRTAPGGRGARVGTRHHRTYQGSLQLQKDGLMSVTRSRKKADEAKLKAPQQAQEALEEARQKHAAAREACASVEQESEEEEDEDEEGMQDADQNKGREPFQEWYNPSAHFSQSTEMQEMRTAVSQISATLALLVKALPPGMLEAGTPSQLQQTRAPQSGARVEGTSSAIERFALATSPKLPADSNKENKVLEKTNRKSCRRQTL